MILLHDAPLFRMYFGNSSDALYPSVYLKTDHTNSTDKSQFDKAKKTLNIKNLFFLHQTHSAQGYSATPELLTTTNSFALDGDFLITSFRAIGVGIMTADCLPIIAYDPIHNAIGIAHAGWRGSVNNIAITMVKQMQKEYKTHLNQLQIFFGPSAKVCCYEVDQSFKKNLENYPFFEQTLREHDNTLFFDLSLFNRLQLEAMGIDQSCFNVEYNICTMCDPLYFSHRRDGNSAGRNMTIVSLK